MDAKSYTKHAILQRSHAFRFIAEHYEAISKLPRGSRILDLGCGTGEVTQLFGFFTNIREIIGLDLSPEMIEIAQQQNKDSRFRFQVGSMEKQEDYPGGTFNLIFANSSLHWAKDQPNLLRIIHDRLAPGGLFLAAIYAGEGSFTSMLSMITDSKWTPKLDQTTVKAIQIIQNQPWLSVIGDRSSFYRGYLEKSGLDIVECKMNSHETFLNEEEIKGFIHATVDRAAKGVLSDDDYEKYFDEACNAFKSELSRSDDPEYYVACIYRIIVLAKKNSHGATKN